MYLQALDHFALSPLLTDGQTASSITATMKRGQSNVQLLKRSSKCCVFVAARLDSSEGKKKKRGLFIEVQQNNPSLKRYTDQFLLLRRLR